MSENFEPEILVLYCGRVLADGNYLPEGTRRFADFSARFVMVPCSSKILPQYLVKPIEGGTDGVLVVACPVVECQFLVGSARAENIVRFARILLDEVGIGADRLEMVHGHGLSGDAVITLAEKRASTVRTLGPNPLKSVKLTAA